MSQSPSIVPEDSYRDVYLVLDDFGSLLGQAWREVGEDDTERLPEARISSEAVYRGTGSGGAEAAYAEQVMVLLQAIWLACIR